MLRYRSTLRTVSNFSSLGSKLRTKCSPIVNKLWHANFVRRKSCAFPILGINGAAVSDEQLATASGLDTLRRGGNAADAAVTMAATLQMVQTMSCGVGGDCFAIFYDATKQEVRCVDGSGRSPALLTLDRFLSGMKDGKIKPECTGLQATVPGAVKAWFEIINHFGSGKLHMADLFEAAIHYGEKGFPVGKWCTNEWALRQSKLRNMHGGSTFLDRNGLVPVHGAVLRNVPLAGLLRRIAAEGIGAFYEGPVAQCIVNAVTSAGGIMTLVDLQSHMNSAEPEVLPPVSTAYRETTVHTMPLPSQGAILLEALNILEGYDISSFKSKPTEFYHLMIEALRLAFADGLSVVADPEYGSTDIMISKEHARQKRALIDVERAMKSCAPEGLPSLHHTGTLVAAAVDAQGNACCLIGSTGLSFGCTVVSEYGFPVHSRGAAFNTLPGHPNCVGPRKKPYHTLMPVVVTDSASGRLLAVMGSQGGRMTPQALLQVILSTVDHGLDSQEAVSKLRIQVGCIKVTLHPDDPLTAEEGIDPILIESLKNKGHRLRYDPSGVAGLYMGHVSVIATDECGNGRNKESHRDRPTSNVLWCGSDPRCDGSAMTY
uniref:Putative gamma-glutamyltransferase amino acid transport and metabolism n=1 Tax=Ixodes ricinus TaxID=34613 RepID=A0A6B0VEH0_IXORI